MLRRVCLLCFLLVCFDSAIYPQTERPRWPTLPEPQELSGPAKKNTPTQLSDSDRQFFEIGKDLRSDDSPESRSKITQLDSFLDSYPTYSDAYFLRATYNACIFHNRDFVSIEKDIDAALSNPPGIMDKKAMYSLRFARLRSSQCRLPFRLAEDCSRFCWGEFLQRSMLNWTLMPECSARDPAALARP
jgi:hypothetical protein